MPTCEQIPVANRPSSSSATAHLAERLAVLQTGGKGRGTEGRMASGGKILGGTAPLVVCRAERSPCGIQRCTMGMRRFVQARCEGTTSNPILASRLLAPEIGAHNGNWEDVMRREVRDDASESAASYKRDMPFVRNRKRWISSVTSTATHQVVNPKETVDWLSDQDGCVGNI